MACHRGDDASAFAHMLVHETSHGFNHRWMSPVRLPNWLNEGIAEWVGTQVVPRCRQVPLKEAQAVEFMRAGGTVGPGFFDDGADAQIGAVQYGIAAGLVKFLVARDRTRFAAFVQGVKEGQGVEESLQQTFRATLDELIRAYGTAVGVPALAHAWPLSTRVILSLVALSVLSTALANLLYYRLMKRTSPTISMSVTYLIPCFSLLWGWLFLDETITLLQMGGFAVVLVAVALVAGRWR
jgi:uncharacterized membrane protein